MRLPPDARLRADVGDLLEKAGEPGDEEVLDPILIHLRLLARWNHAYNLTRITDWPEVLDRHVRESLLPLKWIARERPGRILDVGSGNGYPAFPILACRSLLQGVLLERSERKGLFLEAVIRECGWLERAIVDATEAERYRPGTSRDGQPTGTGMSAADEPGPHARGSDEALEKSARTPSGPSSAADNRSLEDSCADPDSVDDGGPDASSMRSPRPGLRRAARAAGRARWVQGASDGRSEEMSAADGNSHVMAPSPPSASIGDDSARGIDPSEETASTVEPLFDYVITRATLPPPRFLKLATRWVALGGRVLLLAGDSDHGLDVSGRSEDTQGLARIARERVAGRRASYLHVFERASH